jgi:hypothetical protein
MMQRGMSEQDLDFNPLHMLNFYIKVIPTFMESFSFKVIPACRESFFRLLRKGDVIKVRKILDKPE